MVAFSKQTTLNELLGLNLSTLTRENLKLVKLDTVCDLSMYLIEKYITDSVPISSVNNLLTSSLQAFKTDLLRSLQTKHATEYTSSDGENQQSHGIVETSQEFVSNDINTNDNSEINTNVELFSKIDKNSVIAEEISKISSKFIALEQKTTEIQQAVGRTEDNVSNIVSTVNALENNNKPVDTLNNTPKPAVEDNQILSAITRCEDSVNGLDKKMVTSIDQTISKYYHASELIAQTPLASIPASSETSTDAGEEKTDTSLKTTMVINKTLVQQMKISLDETKTKIDEISDNISTTVIPKLENVETEITNLSQKDTEGKPSYAFQAAQKEMKICMGQLKTQVKQDITSYTKEAEKRIRFPGKTDTDNKFITSNGRGNFIQYNPAKTLIISGHLDKTINDSRNMRKAMWQLFPNIGIHLAYPTQRGTLTFQFANESDAQKICDEWDTKNFGGGSKARMPYTEKMHGVLKDVPLEWTDEHVKEIIEQQAREGAVENCRRIFNKGRPTMAVAVKFATNKDLTDAIDSGIKAENMRLNMVESYGKRRQITRCFNCQEFGHVARLCINSKKCKTCGENHDDEPDGCKLPAKCSNCTEAHAADSPKCKKFQTYRDNLLNSNSSW